MVVTVTTEHRFFQTPDGAVWTDGINSYDFWKRYLAVFDRVKVAARIREVGRRDSEYRRADGCGVVFIPVPDFVGPWQYLANAARIRRAVRAAVAPSDAVILRVSSHLAGCLEPQLARRGQPFALEVVNDPFDVFAPGAVRYWLRPFFRHWFTRQLQRQCRTAKAVAYVTGRALQARYPSDGFRAGVSDVEISEDAIRSPAVRSSPQLVSAPGDPFRLVTVASLAQMYKAPDVLIRAVADCIQKGWNLTLAIVGDGRHRPELECLASRLGVGKAVAFLGQLPAGAAVREQLDRSDLFVLASRCEGLPRAMVEAMARSLPCIGSTVGGIPELLPPEDLVPPGDAASLAARIREVLTSPERMTAMSHRNFKTAWQYRDNILGERRQAFLNHVRQATSEWLADAGLTESPETAELVGRA